MNFRKIDFLIALVLGCVVSASAYAAPDVVPPTNIVDDASIQMNRTRQYLERERVARQIKEDQARMHENLETEKAPQQAEVQDAISFKLTKIEVGKSLVLSDDELAGIINPYLDKDVTINDVYDIVGKINDLYNEKGYITCRAFLPQQTVIGGVVKLLLVEGTTGNTTVIGNKNLKSKYITDRINLTEGELANIHDLNKDILLFNATNSTQLRIIMKAGEKPGTTDYELVAYEPKNISWTTLVDNAGSYTSGQYRFGLFMNTKSLSGHGDNLSLGTILSEGTKAANAYYSRSIGHSGTKLNLLYSTNSVKTTEGTWKDSIKGHANSYGIGVTQPLYVDERMRSEVSFDYNHQNSTSDLVLQGTRFSIVDDTVKDFTLAYAQTNYGQSHIIYQKHSYVFGNSNSSPEMSLSSSRDYGFYKFNGIYQKAYTNNHLLNVRADAQWSSTKGLVSARQFYMGGMYSVRGYKENYLGGDSGFVLSTEYQVPVFDNNTAAFTFFDYGHVYDNGQSADADRILASVGFGIKATINNKYSGTLSIGLPLRRDFQSEKVSKSRWHFMISGLF